MHTGTCEVIFPYDMRHGRVLCTGRNGPSSASGCHFSVALHVDDHTLSQGMHMFTLQRSGIVSIKVSGAKGGNTGQGSGGNGALISADFELLQGTEIKVLVGQPGKQASNSYSGGGGGGTLLHAKG